ncbi:MAG: peptidase C1A papain [Sphingobacteriales bacterium]|nr:peptidase C1A papain [Sphingobacteriales bacterium]MBI3717885.1 peptidase C1A papain [Sphingobacteriales bacterium]
MPIRMVDDPQDQEEQNRSNDDSGGGGGNFPGGGGSGGLFNLLPLLLGLFRGKGIIALLVIGGILYFMMGRGGCNMGGGGGIADVISQFTRGGELNRDTFDKAKIFEGLDDYKNPLPEAANLQRFAPYVGDQGQQGSCVAWSSGYAARTILEAAKTNQDPDQLKFSPAFLYNNIKLEGCQGSYVLRAMEFMSKQGAVPYDRFAYDDQQCDKMPPAQLYDEAKQFRIAGFNRLTRGDNTDAIDLNAIRANLAQGAPVVIGMMVGQSFMQSMMGQDVWEPAAGDRNMMGFGGHAMCVVGYDDKKYGGAFLLMNSWTAKWGNNGFAWVRYPDFKYFVREAYGLEPMHKQNEAYSPFSCEVGLVQVEYDGKKTVPRGYIQLQSAGGNTFETVSPIKIGSRFKMEVHNTTECYVYIFGKETDGTSYTLFPYPKTDNPTLTKYSPFCGITGYRLFPKDKSMSPDSVGTRDAFAVVVSKEELDWYQLNKQISENPSADFGSRVNKALGNKLIKNVKFSTTDKGNVSFKADTDSSSVVAWIVEADKN